jgi:hypothetical protein
MRTMAAWVLAILLPSAAAAQSRGFQVWERPAAGLTLGASGNGDRNSGHSGPEIGLVFDTPVVFGYRVRADASRVSWLFEERDYHGALLVSDSVTLESIRVGVHRVRYAGARTAGYMGAGYGVYRYGYRHMPLHNPWRGGLHGVAGLELLSPNQRRAFDVEVRLHAIDGTGQPPVFSVALFKLDAAIGMKLRF